jgi:hypothetical protein
MFRKIAVLLMALVMGAGGVLLASYASSDDAPGGVLIGIVVVLGAGALGVLGVHRLDGRHQDS